jgi:hypothetical protein
MMDERAESIESEAGEMKHGGFESRTEQSGEAVEEGRVWGLGDRCRIILEEAGTWTSCVPSLS